MILGAMLLAAIFTLMSPVAARTHMFGLMGMRAAIGFTQVRYCIMEYGRDGYCRMEYGRAGYGSAREFKCHTVVR